MGFVHPPRRVLEKFLGRYVPPTFSKVGSPEISWLETGVLGTNFHEQISMNEFLLKFQLISAQELKFSLKIEGLWSQKKA